MLTPSSRPSNPTTACSHQTLAAMCEFHNKGSHYSLDLPSIKEWWLLVVMDMLTVWESTFYYQNAHIFRGVTLPNTRVQEYPPIMSEREGWRRRRIIWYSCIQIVMWKWAMLLNGSIICISAVAGRKTFANHSLKFAVSIHPESDIEYIVLGGPPCVWLVMRFLPLYPT